MDIHQHTSWEQTPDGAITVTVLPPLPAGQAYGAEAIQAALESGRGKRVVSRRP